MPRAKKRKKPLHHRIRHHATKHWGDFFSDWYFDAHHHRVLWSMVIFISVLIMAGAIVSSLEVTNFSRPADPEYQRIASYVVIATAYSSTPDQTDDTPCITADGFNVCRHDLEQVIATNFLPIGTKVRFPDLYGDRIFVVHDRMNEKYHYGRVDLWLRTRERAIRFGAKRITMEVIEVEE